MSRVNRIAMIAWIFVFFFVGCKDKVEVKKEDHKPWVVVDQGAKKQFDAEALTTILLFRCGEGVSRSGDVFKIRLGHEPPGRDKYGGSGSLKRHELLEIAKEIQGNLPEGCPFQIEVETVEDAMNEAWIEMEVLRYRRARLGEIHGEK